MPYDRLRNDLIAQNVLRQHQKKRWPCHRWGTIGRQEYRAVTRGSRNACARGWIVYQRDTEEMNANKRLLALKCVTL